MTASRACEASRLLNRGPLRFSEFWRPEFDSRAVRARSIFRLFATDICTSGSWHYTRTLVHLQFCTTILKKFCQFSKILRAWLAWDRQSMKVIQYLADRITDLGGSPTFLPWCRHFTRWGPQMWHLIWKEKHHLNKHTKKNGKNWQLARYHHNSTILHQDGICILNSKKTFHLICYLYL